MGKSIKKSTKVAASPDAAAASPAAAAAAVVTNKSANKGKRDTNESIEKLVSAKKQKLDVIAQQAIQKKIIKKVQPEESGSESEDGDESGSESEDEEEPAVTAAPIVAPVKNDKLAAPVKADGSDEEDESDDEEAEGSSESESEDEKPAEAAKVDNESDEEYSEGDDEDDSSEDEEEKPSKTPTKNAKVAKVDAKAPNTPQIQSGEAKTLYIGNLAFSVEQSDVEKFFKAAGEVVGVRLASDAEGKFRGFGHVDFATPEGAKKALELNGQPLLGRDVKLDLAKERTEKAPAGKGLTIFVRGFDTSAGEDKVKSVLEEHFGPCGDITRIHILKDYETSEIKGIAYLDFSDKESLNKALEYDGEDLGGHTLKVEEARPKGDSSGGRSGGRVSGGGRGVGRVSGGGRGGGRGFGGGRGGGRGFGGGRGGGRGFRGGRGGGRGGGGRRSGGGRRGGSMSRFE